MIRKYRETGLRLVLRIGVAGGLAPVRAVVADSVLAPEVAQATVAGATNFDAQAEITEILDLEQRAEFGRAIQRCMALQGRPLAGAEIEQSRALLVRLREEKKTALELSFAIDSLGAHKDLAARELLKDEAVGVLLLRRALREREDDVMVNAAAVLAAKGDPRDVAPILNRLVTSKDQSAQTSLLNSLEMLKDVMSPGVTVNFIDGVAAADTARNYLPILSILSVLSSTNDATNVVAVVYQHARKDETFTNRYAVAFLGMVRAKHYKNKANGFGEAVGDPEASAKMAGYMKDLAARRDEKESEFFLRCARYFPELECFFEHPITVDGWSPQGDVAEFAQTPTGNLVGTIVGNDPVLLSRDNLNIDLSRYKMIKLTFRNQTSGKRGKFYFATTADHGIGEAQVINFAIKPLDPGYTEYVIDASASPKWKGTLKQLRLDMVDDGAKGKFDISRVILSDFNSIRK